MVQDERLGWQRCAASTDLGGAAADRPDSSVHLNLKPKLHSVIPLRPLRLSSRKAARTVSVAMPKRLQVEQVKARYYEKRKLNPGYSLLSITRQVFEDGRRQGLTDGFNSLQGLNARAVREIKREDNGLPAF